MGYEERRRLGDESNKPTHYRCLFGEQGLAAPSQWVITIPRRPKP